MNRRAILIPLALACLAGIAAVALAASGGGAGGARAAVTEAAPMGAGGARANLAGAGQASARAGARRRPRARGASAPIRRSPGSLPQTDVRPSAHTTQFHALMRALWAGIAGDSLAPALPAFFPRGAYAQLKAIPSASSDWRGRLVYDYGLDIHAAHALLGRDATAARLLAVDVPASYAHWVPPGVCYNRIGYYEVPNARVVYSAHGHVRSFGIASMISWRGVWYVVHLGAILRSSDTGQLDEPSAGRGVSSYSGTC
jgi:hypothetical protein